MLSVNVAFHDVSFSRGLSPEEEVLVEVSSPHLDWYWELMTGVNEVIADENSDLERSFGIDAERDLLEPTDARVQTVAAALEWFGLASIEVYRWRGGGYRCVVQPGDDESHAWLYPCDRCRGW